MSKVTRIRPDQPPVPGDKPVAMMVADELRAILDEVVERKLKARLSTARPGALLNVEQAAEFLGYSKDWVYKNWGKIGGKKIGGKGVRFDALDLERWVQARNDA